MIENKEKQTIIKNINDVVHVFDNICKYADIDNQKLLLNDVDITYLDKEFLLEGYEWLIQIRLGTFKAIEKIWYLLRPEDWERYKKYEWTHPSSSDNFRELVLLRKAIKCFQTSIKIKHPLFLKGGRNERAKRNKKATTIHKRIEKSLERA